MIDSNSIISITAFNFNEINTSIKRHRLSERAEQGLPNNALSTRAVFYKDGNSLKVNQFKKCNY